MVRVSKIAVWKIGDTLIQDAQSAETYVRELVIAELLRETNDAPAFNPMGIDEISSWVSFNHNMIEQRVKAAMAGA